MYWFVNKEKYCHICLCAIDFISLYLFVLTFEMKLKDANDKTHWNTLFCDQ